MKKRITLVMAVMIMSLFYAVGYASVAKITSLDSFQYDASQWFASSGNRAYVAAALYGEAEKSFRDEVGVPAKVLIGKGIMNDGTTEYLVLDYVSSSGKYYFVSFYPVGTTLDAYPHAIYNIGSPTSATGAYQPLYTITESEFSSAYTKWQSSDAVRASKITSLDGFHYDASDWFATSENRAYVAAALYGEAEEVFRERVGVPENVLIGKGLMDDGTTETLVLDYVTSSGFYLVWFYPVGTPLDAYPHAFYFLVAEPFPLTDSYRPFYTIAESEFSAAYTKWQNDDHTGEPEDSPYLFSFIGHNNTNTVSFSLPARGYIDLTLNKAYINSLTPYGYYDIKLYQNESQIFYIDSYEYYEKSKENYTIGLAPGDYSIEFSPKGFLPSNVTLNTLFTCSFVADNYYEVEQNNSMRNATAIKTNIVYTGYLGEDKEGQDYYSCALKAGRHYQIRFPGFEALKATTAIIRLIDSSGKEKYVSLSETAEYFYYDFTPTKDDTYYIKIYNYHGYKYGVIRYQIGIFEEIDLTKMNTLYLPQQLRVIKADAFKGGDFEAVVIPDSCTRIGSKAFADCKNLRYVEMPASLTDIAVDAFEMQNGIQIERR